MVTTTWERPKPISTGQLLSAFGIVTAIFSLIVAALLVFVIPVACTFLGGLYLVLLAMLFVAGVIAFGIGKLISRRQKRTLA